MLGFFRKRTAREHAKLLEQNLSACEYLQGYFDERSKLTDLNSAKIDNDFAELCAILYSIRDEIDAFPIANADYVNLLLKMNKNFRIEYDRLPLRPALPSFDKFFVPTGGWRFFYDRHQV